jgi:hypothetical protein
MRFVIIAAPRTGSSQLTVRLREHPDVLCHGEVFHRKNLYVYWPKRDLTDDVKMELSALRQADPDALLERVLSANYGRSCVGFKIFFGQCDPVLDTILDDPAIRKVVLFRRNVLANYSSALAASRSGSWSTKEDLDPSSSHKVKFKAEQFIRFHNDYVGSFRNVIDRLNTGREPYHLIYYEDINDAHMFASLISFIGTDPRQSRKTERRHLKKQSSPDILSRFSNPDEVAAFVNRYRLTHWMYEAHPDFHALADLGEKDVATEEDGKAMQDHAECD